MDRGVPKGDRPVIVHSMSPIVSAAGLTKIFRRSSKPPGVRGALRHLVHPEYSDVTAVDGVNLSIEPGESVAYVGPNGAGKSTTIKLLTGILVPTAGQVDVCGLTPFRDRQRNALNISAVFGQRTQLWWDIPVIESFRLLGDIYSVPAANYRTTLAELVDVLELGPLLDVPARQLSLGQRMRCDLAAALVHSPRVLFMDEPTIGLDVAVKARLREFVGSLVRDRGMTLMLTSHDLGDIELLCPRLVMIDGGRIVFDGPYAEVARQFAWETVVTVTTGTTIDPDVLELAVRGIATSVDYPSQTTARVGCDRRTHRPGQLVAAIGQVLDVVDIAVADANAEDVIRSLFEGELRFSDQDPS